MELRFEQPTERHIQALVENMADEDRRELLALGFDPEYAVRYSISVSEEVVAISDGDTLGCIVGLAEPGGIGAPVYPWLLGTKIMVNYPLTVMRISKRLMKHWSAKHTYMSNYVDQRHDRAIRWLRHLGAAFELIPEFGPYRRPFYKFSFGSE